MLIFLWFLSSHYCSGAVVWRLLQISNFILSLSIRSRLLHLWETPQNHFPSYLDSSLQLMGFLSLFSVLCPAFELWFPYLLCPSTCPFLLKPSVLLTTNPLLAFKCLFFSWRPAFLSRSDRPFGGLRIVWACCFTLHCYHVSNCCNICFPGCQAWCCSLPPIMQTIFSFLLRT